MKTFLSEISGNNDAKVIAASDANNFDKFFFIFIYSTQVFEAGVWGESISYFMTEIWSNWVVQRANEFLVCENPRRNKEHFMETSFIRFFCRRVEDVVKLNRNSLFNHRVLLCWKEVFPFWSPQRMSGKFMDPQVTLSPRDWSAQWVKA